MATSAPGPDDKPIAATPPSFAMENGAPDGADHSRRPLLAALGAGDAAVAAVARAFADAYTAAATRQKNVQQRVADLPSELDALRGRFSPDELRRALDAYRAQVERTYAEFAGRGEEAWGRLREQPPVRQAITTLETYTGRLDTRVDEAQDAATRVLAAAERQTRATGERVARAGQRLSGRAADAVVDVSTATSEAVEEAGSAAATVIEDTGEETAAATRKVTRVTPRRSPRRTSRPASE